MYKTLWNYTHRPAAFLALLTAGWSVLGVLAGLLVCLGLQKELMIKLTVIFCTGGYAGLILGFFGGIFYLYRMDLRRRNTSELLDTDEKIKESLYYLKNKTAV